MNCAAAHSPPFLFEKCVWERTKNVYEKRCHTNCLQCSKKYKENLANKNFMIVFKNRENNKIEYRPNLYVDMLAGNISVCLCFVKEENYYIPNTCLLGDIRNFGKSTSQILAILSKPANKSCPTYIDIEYLAKGFNPDNLKELNKVC